MADAHFMKSRGFGLIELMVGVLVSMLLAVAVYGMVIVGEGGRRATIGGNTAFGNGAAAALMMQNELKNAGNGLYSVGSLICDRINVYRAGVVIANGAPIAPVQITDAESPEKSDTLTVAQGTSLFAGVGATISFQMASSTGTIRLNSIRALQAGGLYLASNRPAGNVCTVGQITAVTPQANGGDVEHATAEWNPANPDAVFADAPAYAAGSTFAYLGNFQWATYQVVDGRLERQDLLRGTTAVIAENVALLKAWYGTSDGTSPAIEQWTAGSGGWTAPLDYAHASAVRAVRLVLVTRSAAPEKPSKSGLDCDATTEAPQSWEGGPDLDLTGNAQWKCYRYRVVRLVIPLKNVMIGS